MLCNYEYTGETSLRASQARLLGWASNYKYKYPGPPLQIAGWNHASAACVSHLARITTVMKSLRTVAVAALLGLATATRQVAIIGSF